MKIDQFADYVFENGTVITVNAKDDICQAIAVASGRILCVGRNEDMQAYISGDTKVIDLKGRAVLPGLIESHIHFTLLSMTAGNLVSSVASAANVEDVRSILKKAVSGKKPGEWVFLSDYDQNRLQEQRHLTHEDFDDLTPDNPVRCRRVCCHMSVYNKKAMEMAGITDDTPFENPDEVARTADGKLTGLFKEAAQLKVLDSIGFSREECRRAFQCGQEQLLRCGVTSIHDMGSGMDNFGRNVLQDEVAAGRIKLRSYISFNGLDSRAQGLAAARHILELGPHTGIGNDQYKMGPLKILLDGSTSGPSSYMKEPYCHDPELKGLQNYPDQQEINELMLEAYRQGFQATAHAVGDAAVEQILTAYEYVNEHFPIKERRFRIEHAGFTSPENAERIRDLGVIVISNPIFLTINGKVYNHYYGKRTEEMFPHKTYESLGIVEGFGTDCPVAAPNPILSIYGAVNRRDIACGEVCGESQKIDVLRAIRCQTYNNAYASFEETIKGSLEPGKLADLVVLSEDILACAPEQIKGITVDCTMINGEIVYRADMRENSSIV